MRMPKFAVLCYWLLTPILILAMSASLVANVIYLEDFEDDNVPGAPNFASSVFVHNVAGPNSFFTVPFFPTPSPPHAFFMGVQTTDLVTFNLNPGQTVESAEVWITATGGGVAGVTFLGSNGMMATFQTAIQDNFQLFSVDPSHGLGDIIGVLLGDVPPSPPAPGQEAMYDNLRITVVPEPSSFALIGCVAMISSSMRRRRA